jgi:ABC-type antimicrobial peptide transport system permease subunit
VASLTGLPRAALRRSRADAPVVIGAWLLLVCATTLLTTGVVYGEAVATDGLHRDILGVPPASRAVLITTDADPDRVEALDGGVRSALLGAFGATGGTVSRVARTDSFADRATDPAAVRQLTVFESIDGIENRASLVAGRWAEAAGEPLEATLSEGAAKAFGLAVGGRLALVNRQDATRTADVTIVGIWRPDPLDAFWAGDPLETTGTNEIGDFTTVGPIVVRDADLRSLGGPRPRFALTWRGLPDLAAVRIDDVDRLGAGILGVPAAIRGAFGGENLRMTAALPDVLAESSRSVLVSRSGIILLTIQFAVLAGYAIVLVAGIIVERRRSEIALLRSRGGSAGHLVAMAAVEAVMLALPAAALAPPLAAVVVIGLGAVGPNAGLGFGTTPTIEPTAWLVAALAGLACVVALVLPTLSVSASPAGARAVVGRQARTTLAQRLGLDLAFVVLAGVALWQLRLYGAPITRNARGVLGLDPLLVAAPAIGLIGGAVLAIRIVPRIAEVAERVLARGVGLVAALSGRQLSRRPLRYTRTALLLMLAAALATLASAHAATWTKSQADQAAYQTAADIRVVASDYSGLPTWAAGPLYRAIPGVIAASPVAEETFDVGRLVRSGTIAGLDPSASLVIASDGSPSEGVERQRVLDVLAAAQMEPSTLPLPGEPSRVALTIDADFSADPDVTLGDVPAGDIPSANQLLETRLILVDGDGRIFRTDAATGSITAKDQRLVVDVAALGTAGPVPGKVHPAGPLRLGGIELMLHAPEGLAIRGKATIRRVELSQSASGDADWEPFTVDLQGRPWVWSTTGSQESMTFPPSSSEPLTYTMSADHEIFGFPGSPGVTARLAASLPDRYALPVVASQSFLDKTSASVGDTLTISSVGQPIDVRIVAATALFAPYDPAIPFLIADLRALELVRFDGTDRIGQADAWLLAADRPSTPEVLAALRAPASSTARVVGRDELTRTLSTDPVALGLIGVLGLGSLAAIAFAAIGFLVSSTVSTTERLGEFALLRALGLSTRQLGLWLSVESVFLLVVGLFAGWFLGLGLAWLVLPFATLTQTGATPVPAPEVVVPWGAIVPVVVAVVALFAASVLPVRRQLRDVELGGVLRAQDG